MVEGKGEKKQKTVGWSGEKESQGRGCHMYNCQIVDAAKPQYQTSSTDICFFSRFKVKLVFYGLLLLNGFQLEVCLRKSKCSKGL